MVKQKKRNNNESTIIELNDIDSSFLYGFYLVALTVRE